MNVISLSDEHDARIADYRSLADAALLRRHGAFMAEGRLVVERVLGDSRYLVRSLLLNSAALEALTPAMEASGTDAPIFLGSAGQLEAITGFNLHRGCLALVERPPARAWRTLVAGARRLVVLEGVTNADNVGGAFRNAAAFGVDAVLLAPTCCDPLYRKAIRTSMGTVLRMPFARLDPWPASLHSLAQEGFRLAGLTPREPSLPLATFARSAHSERLALLVGSEGPGLSDGAMQLAHDLVRIPMASGVDSLNLSVALAVALSQLAPVAS